MKVTLKLCRNFNGIHNRKFQKAQNQIDKAVVKFMTPLVPVAPPYKPNSGALRNSVKISNPGVIVYTAPFAKHAYYADLNYSNGGNPNAVRLWFEVTKNRHKGDIIVIVRKSGVLK